MIRAWYARSSSLPFRVTGAAGVSTERGAHPMRPAGEDGGRGIDPPSSSSSSTEATETLTPERAIASVGTGPFQRWLTALCMLGNAADAVEVLSVALVLPTAGQTFGLSDGDKGVLTSAVFLGGLVGAIGWGVVGDKVGRRAALACAMGINALFALLSAAATDFGTLVLCRALAGVGVSGGNTVVFTMLPEFLPAAQRGTYMVLLASGWMWGSIYSASVGWAVIPAGGGGWRAFLVASAMPSLACLVGVVAFMPESPRFLTVKGRRGEAMAVLRRVATWNKRSDALSPHATIQVPGEDTADGDAETREGTGTILRSQGWGERARDGGRESTGRLWMRLPRWASQATWLWKSPLLTRTAGLAFVWFSLSFGWYGLMLWLPEYFARLTPSSPDPGSGGHGAGHGSGGDGGGITGQDSRMYSENLMVAWANLPGNVASAFMVDSLGRRRTLAVCMAAAALAAGFFAIVPSIAMNSGTSSNSAFTWKIYVACACIFNALSVGGWNALDLYCSEAFPTAVRSTAMGTLSAFGRLGSLIGSAANGFLIGQSLMAPLGLASAMMLLGSLVTVGIPLETKGRPLEDSMGECRGESGEEENLCIEGNDKGDGVGGLELESGRLLSGGSILSDETLLDS